MSHVDDGLLHAWLDGALRAQDPARADAVAAHLEACDDCRARLDEARALKEEADAILDLAAPHVDEGPPFETILRRARDEAHDDGDTTTPDLEPAPRTTAPFRWTRRLAWAASITVALGMGWWARDLAYGPDSPGLRVVQPPPAGEPTATRDVMDQTAPPAGTAPAETETGEEARGGPVVRSPDEPATEPAGAAAPGEAEAAAPEVAERAPTRAETRRLLQEPAPAEGEARARVASPEAVSTDRSVNLPAAVVAGTALPGDTLEGWLGAPVWAIEGLPVAVVDTATLADGRRAVLVRQTLEDGGTVVLTQLRADALFMARAPAGAAGEEEARQAETRALAAEMEAAPSRLDSLAGLRQGPALVREGTVVVVSGPLTGDALTALLGALVRLP